MKSEVHKAAAEEYFRIAEDTDKRHAAEKEEARKTALMVVAAQNYFYAAVNCVEAVFAIKLKTHSFSHEDRMRKIIENRALFGKEIVELYDLVDRDQRNKVTYRGENGKKYENIKRLANLLVKTP